MKRARVALAVGAATLGIGTVGVALAATNAGQPGPDPADAGTGVDEQVSTIGSANWPITGITPNGHKYEIALVESKYDGPCVSIRVEGQASEGCIRPLKADEFDVPVQMTLGDDQFILALARESVQALRADQLDGSAGDASSASADVGALRVFHVVLDAGMSGREAESSLPAPPSVRVQAIGTQGVVKAEQDLEFPPISGSEVPLNPPNDATLP
jgi:hypothetical protein